jgi:putative thioredoxin
MKLFFRSDLNDHFQAAQHLAKDAAERQNSQPFAAGAIMRSHTENILDAGEHDFVVKVLDASQQILVLVDFWADWCPPCRALTPLLEKLAREYAGRLVLVKVEVDADDNMKLAGRYRLRGFPTVLLIRDGTEVGRFSGYKPEHFVREMIEGQV